MTNLVLYKDPFIFDRLYDLNKDWEKAIDTYIMGFIGNHGGGINRMSKQQIFKIYDASLPTVISNKKLNDIIEERAVEIVSCHEHINLIWSGGLGSTLILDILLKITKNITLFYHVEDKIDSQIKNHKYNFLEKIEFTKESLLPHLHYITGEQFSIISGYPEKSWFYEKNKIDGNSRINDAFIMNLFFIGKEYSTNFKCYAMKEYYVNLKRAYERIHYECKTLISLSPNKLRFMKDLYWWFSFTHKWYSHQFRLKGIFGKNLSYTNFYQTEDFQNWAIINYDIDRRAEFEKILGYKIPKINSNLTLQRKHDAEPRIRYMTSFIDSDGNFVFDPNEVSKELVANVVN